MSGNNSLTNQPLDSLSKDINESQEFSQNECDDKFKNKGDKVQKLEEEINLQKKDLHIIQITKSLWSTETDAKLVNLEIHSRQNNLRFEGIKEHENESWEDCKKKKKDLWENKLEMDIEDTVTE